MEPGTCDLGAFLNATVVLLFRLCIDRSGFDIRHLLSSLAFNGSALKWSR